MAGKKQHHVWQLLQRGFGEKWGKDHHVWVYRKAEPAKQTVTRLFGFEKHFYGAEGSQADNNITEYENDSQSTIQEIRKLGDGAEVDPKFASTLISHLEMRSAFLREQVSTTAQKSIGGLVERFRSPDVLRSVMLKYLKDNPDKLDKLLGKGFIRPSQRAGFTEIAHQMVEKMPNEEILKSMEHGFGQIGEIVDQFPDLAKESHIKSLVRDVSEHERTKSHLERKYSVFRPREGSLILPDTTLAFVKSQGASPLSQKGDAIEAVILPIAANTAIVGTLDGEFTYPLKAINRILAGCSFEAFLASEKSLKFQGLTGRIGKYAKIISDRELQSLTHEALS